MTQGKSQSEMGDVAYRATAQAIVDAIDSGDSHGASKAIDELTRLRETELFQEVGKLTRQLNDALRAFTRDSRLSDLAQSDMPDAYDRLNHVIKMTDDSAHRTLTAVEGSLDRLTTLVDASNALSEQWGRFVEREMSVSEFRSMARDIDDLFHRLKTELPAMQSELTDALMAQDYQDLTGQIIRRVMTLVQEVQQGLVSMLAISAPSHLSQRDDAKEDKDAEAQTKTGEDDGSELEGPQVPGRESTTAVSSQDEVDDLLDSLGV